MTVSTLYVPTDEELSLRDQLDVYTESLFTIQDAVAELRRALAAINELRPATAAAAIGQALSTIRHALSAVDLDTMTRTTPDPVVTAVITAVASVPRPCFGSCFDEADADDLNHAYATWRRHRIAAAQAALATLERE